MSKLNFDDDFTVNFVGFDEELKSLDGMVLKKMLIDNQRAYAKMMKSRKDNLFKVLRFIFTEKVIKNIILPFLKEYGDYNLLWLSTKNDVEGNKQIEDKLPFGYVYNDSQEDGRYGSIYLPIDKDDKYFLHFYYQ